VDRLVNVAVTRARGKLLTIANESFWHEQTAGKANAFGELCDHQYRYDKVISANNGGLGELLRDYDLGPNIETFDTASAEDALIADLGMVTKRIMISIPDGRLTEPFAGRFMVELRRARSRGVEVLCKCFNYTELNQDWKTISWQSNDAVFPLVVLDGMVYWYGMPPSKMAPPTKDGLPTTTLATPMRITGFNTANMIWSLAKLDQRKSDEANQSLQEKHGTTGPNDSGKAAYGLAKFVKEHEKCPKCHGAMVLARNRRGVHYLRCSKCGDVEYLTKQSVNHYMSVKYVRCSKCGGTMAACRGKFGVFVMCDKDSRHTFGPDQI
jgi:ribosomal protein S27AE